MKFYTLVFYVISITTGALLSSTSAPKAAQVSPSPVQPNTTVTTPGTSTPSPIVTTATGSAQTIFISNAYRFGCKVQDTTGAWSVTWDESDPSAVNGLQLSAGDIFNCEKGVNVVAGSIKILATVGDAIYAEEMVAKGQ